MKEDIKDAEHGDSDVTGRGIGRKIMFQENNITIAVVNIIVYFGTVYITGILNLSYSEE